MTVDIEKPRALIFDWDNTLVDTWPTIHEALRQTFEAMDVEPWTLDQTRQRVRRSMRESFPELLVIGGPRREISSTTPMSGFTSQA